MISKRNLYFLFGATLTLIGYVLGYYQKSQSESVKQANTITQTNLPSSVLSASDSAGLVKVIKIVDGDTIQIEGGIKVRYIGIDTPETVDPRRPDGCFGKEASNKNKEMVLGKMVKLEKDVSETDKFGRLLRYVYVADPELDSVTAFVNNELVRQGFAQVSTYPPDVKYQNLFVESQKYAEENNLGLWKNCIK